MECVVLAAGEGKRMRPLTAKRPKVMLPLANRPMIEHLVLAARDAGITKFVFVVGYGEREIRGHFGDGSALGIQITYASQRQQRGTADALRSAHHLVTGPFILLNGDMILKSTDIADLCKRLFSAMFPDVTEGLFHEILRFCRRTLEKSDTVFQSDCKIRQVCSCGPSPL
jgi:bifunctional UDP-N-acetylglucosamine pyrophosphorylase/glucosamine-1-phosphate N-acetyltransferase